MMMIMRCDERNGQTDDYDLQALMCIRTHYALHGCTENKTNISKDMYIYIKKRIW